MPDFSRPLSLQTPFMRGADVLAAQRALRSLGACQVEPDGIFGSQTGQAVAAFRRQQRLPDGDTIDQQTWLRLFSAPSAPVVIDDIAQIVDRLATPQQFRDSVTWRLTPQGISVGTEPPLGTPGDPVTVRRILSTFGSAIADTGKRRRVPAELIIATIAVESSGQPDARREEPGYVSDSATPDQVSVGLMQTLLSTANQALGRSDIDSAWLTNGANSIEAGTAYIAQQLPATGYDPPKVGCAYNAGSLRYDASPSNRWRMVQYPLGTSDYGDKFVAFFNDALSVLRANPAALDCPTFAQVFASRQVGVAAVDPSIENLALNPVAKQAAYLLKQRHPDVIFTSGRRSKADQARAMSQNVMQRRDWIGATYRPTAISEACQNWVDAHAEADTAPAIAAGLLSVMNSLPDDQVFQLSLHLSGNAFDIQPVVPDVNNIEATVATLPGYKNFLNNEGGLTIWHAEFQPS